MEPASVDHPDTAPGPVSSQITPRLLAGGAWAFLARVGSITGSVILTLILARWVPPSDLGAYFLGMSLATIASSLGLLGLDKAAVKLISSSLATGAKDQVRRIAGLVFAFGAIGASMAGLILASAPGRWIARDLFNSGLLSGVMPLVGVIAGVKVLERLIAENLRGLHRIREAVFFEGFLSNWMLVVIFAVGFLLASEVALSTVLRVTLLISAFIVGVGAVLLVRSLPGGSSGNRKPEVREIFELAGPLYIAALASVLITNLDLWLVGYLLPEESVAVYGIALRLILVVGVPLTIVNAVVPPTIGELAARRELSKLENVLRSSITVAAVPATLAAVILVLAGGPIVRIAFGPEYATIQAAQVVAILTIGQLASIWAGSCGFTLIMSGHQRDFMLSTLLGAALTFAAALALGKARGISGVAIGAAAGLVFQNILMLGLVRRRLGIWTHVSISRVPELLTRGLAELRRGT